MDASDAKGSLMSGSILVTGTYSHRALGYKMPFEVYGSRNKRLAADLMKVDRL